MRWLLRRVIRKAGNEVSVADSTVDTEALTIGRATDQSICINDIRVTQRHARITVSGRGRYRVEALSAAGVRINGAVSQGATVAVGAAIEIGPVTLKPIKVSGYDAALEQTDSAPSIEFSAAASAGKHRPSKRLWAWIGFIAVLVFALLVPMAMHYQPALRTLPLPGTTAWSPGTLDAAHQSIGADCTRCHTQTFARTTETGCHDCHQNAHAHADAARFGLPALNMDRCGGCHEEHRGVHGLRFANAAASCSDCHRNLQSATAGVSKLANASDFGRDHGEFRLQMPIVAADGQLHADTMQWSADLSEHSGLKFNHQKHLVADGLETPNGRRMLECANCHQIEPGGAHMRPIAFESACHDCHKLSFDPIEPEREVVHGRVAEVVYTLDGHYAKRALEGGYAQSSAPVQVQQRRRPGSPPLPVAQKQQALAWARDKAHSVAETLFTGQACVTCHAVTAPTAENPDYMIAPVRVAGGWYSAALFNHLKHASMQCVDCHARAPQSESASDLLIPGIATCRTCHQSVVHTRGEIASDCTLCHVYHGTTTQAATEKTVVSP